MPEQPMPKIRQPGISASPEIPATFPGTTAGFAELNCLTNYSFLQAASHPDEVVQRAADLGYAALAITDRNSLAGVVRAHAAAKPLGLKLLIGAEIELEPGSSVILYARNRAGYGRLARLLTVGKRRAVKGHCQLSFDDVIEHSRDLLACVPLDNRNPELQLEQLHRWYAALGDRCYAVAYLQRGPHDDMLLERYAQIADRTRLPLVASNRPCFTSLPGATCMTFWRQFACGVRSPSWVRIASRTANDI